MWQLKTKDRLSSEEMAAERVGVTALCGLRAWCAVDLIFDFSVYILFACLCYMLSRLSFFSSLFHTYFLPYLFFPLRIDQLRFQARCRTRRLNLTLVFLCLFCVVVHFFAWWVRDFVVLGLVFSIPSQGLVVWWLGCWLAIQKVTGSTPDRSTFR